MRKKVLFFVLVLTVAIVGAFNLNIVHGELGDISLKNIEVISYGENGGITACNGLGTLDCPGVTTKVYFVW